MSIEEPKNINDDVYRDISASLEKIAQSLETLTVFASIWTHPFLLKTLNKVFKSSKQLQAFMLLEKKLGLREIGSRIGVSRTTVGNWFKLWTEEPPIVQQLENGTYQQNMSISELIAIYGQFEEESEEDE